MSLVIVLLLAGMLALAIWLLLDFLTEDEDEQELDEAQVAEQERPAGNVHVLHPNDEDAA